ncbi:MAG: NAD(P)-dependent oxidoreductase [Anaerolineales bacterium]|nr:NAD(P)-dependent oxidoreductase [Anaerolineales bacterium]
MSKEIVVTGGNGRLGRVVIAHVLARGYRVRSLDRAGSPAYPDTEQVTNVVVEMNDLTAFTGAVRGADAIIHLAAFNGPWGQPPGVVYSNNITINYNALSAASELGIKKLALASSVNAYGGLGSKLGHFDYFPVDEKHPTYNEDDYSLSKWIGEVTADSFARRFPDMTISSLRFHALPDAPPVLQTVYETAEAGSARNLWGWTLVTEAARAALLAVEADFKGHEIFNIMAPRTNSTIPSMELAHHAYPNAPFRQAVPGTNSLFDCSKAARLLSWVHADVG